jgi:transposase
MTDDELRHLGPEEVIGRFRQLEARIAELEAALARQGGPGKTSANSSVPPSKSWKAKRAPKGGKRGPPVGHVGRSRPRGEPGRVVHCRPTHCRECGEALAAAGQRRVGVSQVVDLPPLGPVVVEAWRYAATCATCGTTTRGAYPVGLEPTRVFGPQLQAVLSYLHHQHHVGYARLRAIAHEWFGLPHLSQGAIARALRHTAEQLAPQVAAIAEQVRASPVIGSDETSARVNGRTEWQWVFQTPTASYHTIQPRRNGDVVRAFQGETRAGTWVSDCYRPQLNAQAERHQICLAHQHRDLQYVIDCEQSAWAQACQQLFRDAIHRAHQRDRGELWGAAYQATVRKLEAACDHLVAERLVGAEANRLQTRFREQRAQLLVFLHDPAVPPTNNASEQALRNSVIHRKVTGGLRSDWGAEAHAALATVMDTARKQDRPVLATLQATLGASIALLPQA